jgi:hypothetical protein
MNPNYLNAVGVGSISSKLALLIYVKTVAVITMNSKLTESIQQNPVLYWSCVFLLIVTSAYIINSHNTLLSDSMLSTQSHWIMKVGVLIVAVAFFVAESIFMYFACFEGYRWMGVVAAVLIVLSVLANTYALSSNELKSVDSTKQGELIRSQLDGLRQQLTVQTDLLGKCPSTHQKNCIQPINQTIAELNTQIATLTASLQQQSVSKTAEWGNALSKWLDIPMNAKIVVNLIIALLVEVIAISMATLLLATHQSNPFARSQQKGQPMQLNIESVVVSSPKPDERVVSTAYSTDSTNDNSDPVQGSIDKICQKTKMGREAIIQILTKKGIQAARSQLNVGTDLVAAAKRECAQGVS